MQDMTPEEERVWSYIVKKRGASIEEIALNCDVTDRFVEDMIDRIGSEDWREPFSPDAGEGQKFDTGKARYDLIPPEIEEAIAQVLTFGAAKYGNRNWELGMGWGRPYAALRRHLNAWWAGEDKDPETGMSHLWHVACCAAFLVTYEARGAGTDDRPERK